MIEIRARLALAAITLASVLTACGTPHACAQGQ